MKDRLRCPGCGLPTIEDSAQDIKPEEALCAKCAKEIEAP